MDEENNKRKSLLKGKKIIICSIIIFIVIIIYILIFTLGNSSKKTVELTTQVNEVSEWKYEIKNKKIVKLDHKKLSGDVNDNYDGKIIEKYTFKALKPGKTSLKFTFINKKNLSYGEIKYYEVIVNKKLELSINEITEEKYNNI